MTRLAKSMIAIEKAVVEECTNSRYIKPFRLVFQQVNDQIMGKYPSVAFSFQLYFRFSPMFHHDRIFLCFALVSRVTDGDIQFTH